MRNRALDNPWVRRSSPGWPLQLAFEERLPRRRFAPCLRINTAQDMARSAICCDVSARSSFEKFDPNPASGVSRPALRLLPPRGILPALFTHRTRCLDSPATFHSGEQFAERSRVQNFPKRCRRPNPEITGIRRGSTTKPIRRAGLIAHASVHTVQINPPPRGLHSTTCCLLAAAPAFWLFGV